MNQELESKLIKKYPKIFVDTDKSAQESCMHWGLEVGDGWYNIIETLCEAFTYTYSTSVQVDEEDGKRLKIKPSEWPGKEPLYFFEIDSPQAIATQVKEKFGTLRFYYMLKFTDTFKELLETKKYPDLERVRNRYTDYFDGIVHYAEIASGRTCEVTGKPGQMCVRGGWFKVLCDEEATKRDYEPYKRNEIKD